MALNVKIFGALILIGVMLMLGAESSPNTSITEWRCNADSYSENDPYADNVDYVLADLVAVTPNAGYYYYNHSPSNTDVCYGIATCASPLSLNDCAVCLFAARAAVKDICADKIGAAVQMVDCTIRYENYYV